VIGAGAAFAALQPIDELKASWTVLPGNGAGDPQPKVVRLSSNENPYGPSPASLKAINDSFSLAWRYPDEYADMLSEELAKLHGVPVEQLLLGDGSGEVLKLCATAFTSKDKKLVMANPTFEAIGRHAAVAGAEVVKINLTADILLPWSNLAGALRPHPLQPLQKAVHQHQLRGDTRASA
jgi:histidinol-phosphate/aromatic aminotransferase/cobyric acid decarboxylase-like protein